MKNVVKHKVPQAALSQLPAAEENAHRLRRAPLPTQLLEILRTEIINGVWAPGSRLPEVTLCERFGVSRTPLREALKTLESEGLLRISPNRGAMVTEVTIADIEDKMRVLQALEVLAVTLACTVASDDELRMISKLNQSLGKTIKQADDQNDPRNFYMGNYSFHQAVVRASHSPTLIEMHESLHRHVQRVRHLIGLAAHRGATALQEHNQLVEALLARDAEGARAAMAAHLDDVLDRLLQAMRRQQPLEAQ